MKPQGLSWFQYMQNIEKERERRLDAFGRRLEANVRKAEAEKAANSIKLISNRAARQQLNAGGRRAKVMYRGGKKVVHPKKTKGGGLLLGAKRMAKAHSSLLRKFNKI